MYASSKDRAYSVGGCCLIGWNSKNIHISKMGNLITQSLQLYSLEWIPPRSIPDIRSLNSTDDITDPQHTKILIPISKIAKRREFVLKHHHQVILIQDSSNDQHLIRTTLRGIPVVHEQDVVKDPSCCSGLRFDNRFCPIPLVLERFHESYLKNYVNSFRFYGIEVLAYHKTEEYLHSACCNPFLVCSNYELEQLSFKMQGRAGRDQHKLTVLCFCNKDEYELSKRIELFLQKEGIEVCFFKNILDIIERLNAESLAMPPELQVRTERVLFYLSEKEKEVEYLSKMAKRLQKSVRNIVVEKVHSRQALMANVRDMNYSIIVVSSDPKEMRSYFELYEALEREGLEDRVIFVSREHEISEKLTQRVYSVVEKHKYRRSSIFEKEAIFYGSLDFFKHVLRNFPALRFKRFIDSSKEREKVKQFLGVQNELVVTNVKLCNCQEYFSNEVIRCRVVHIHSKLSSLRSQERREEGCEREKWVADEVELVDLCSSGELLSVNFNYCNKRVSYIGKTLNDFFAKMKEKKTILYNKLNDAMFLFSTEYYTLDQICSFILRYFTSKPLGNYEHDCLFPQLKTQLYSELEFLSRSRRIEQAVLDRLEGDCSADIYELSHAVMGLVIEHGQLLEEVNSIWALFLYQDRKEHQTNCQVLLFLLLLAFSKTSFIKYSNETLQGLTLLLRRNSTAYDPDNLNTFRNKNRNNFVYNVEFLTCELYQEGAECEPSDILIRVEGNELTSFHMYMPLWRRGSRVIIAPFTKFQINVKTEREYLLKLSVNSQHKLLEKFTQSFLEENASQLKLFEEGREMRRFDVFLDSMAHSKFETAGYILKKIMKEESMANEDCFNAYCVLYHLKRNQVGLAEERLRADRYQAILTRVIKGLREGEPSDEKCLIPETFSSSKRIEENNKEYQNIEETSNDNESFDNPAMIQTDPEMIKQLSSDYRLNLKLRNRSPSSKLKDRTKHKNGSKIPIHNKRTKPQLSICDKLSESSKASRKDRQVNIVILPPSRQPPGDNCFNSSTFGNKFLTEYSSMSSEKEKTHKEEITELMRIKSTKSDAGGLLSCYDDIVIESTPMLKRISSVAKPSQFCVENERQMDFQEADSSKDELLLSDNQHTGHFHFQATRAEQEQSQQIIQEKEEMEEVVEESEKSSSKASERNKSTMEESSFFEGLPKPREKMFPIKKKEMGKKRKSLTLQQPNLPLFDSPLRNIEEERSSQLSISNSNLILSPSEKEGELVRNKENKLFTFFKISETFKPRFSISSNKNSLNLSNNSHLERIDEKKESLFYDFEEEKLSGTSSLNSISSIDIESVEQVHPEEILQGGRGSQ